MAYPITHTVHGIHFSRQGECDQCKGRDRPACNCDYQGDEPGMKGQDCPHFAHQGQRNVCLIQGQKHLHCDVCWPGQPERTHLICAEFPDHPWLRVIMDGQCSYSFLRVDDLGELDHTPLPFM